MNFSFLLVLCLFNLIHGRYLLVDVDDQQVREQTPPPPRIQETKPPAPTCIHPGGKCFSKTKFSISIEFSARSVKSSAECCQGYTCVSGMCLKPEIKIEGLGKSRSIGKCKNHQEYCGCMTTYPPICHGDCCDTLTCEFYGVGGAGTCVNKDQCYFTYGFGSRMVPCCLEIISREEHDRLVEENAKRPILGSAFGKHHSCPKSAEEAHQILNQESNQKNAAPESRECRQPGQTCMGDSECCSQNCTDDGTCGAL